LVTVELECEGRVDFPPQELVALDAGGVAGFGEAVLHGSECGGRVRNANYPCAEAPASAGAFRKDVPGADEITALIRTRTSADLLRYRCGRCRRCCACGYGLTSKCVPKTYCPLG